MKNIRKIGGFASLAFGLSFTVLLILLITIASQGYVPGSGNNPVKALEFAGSSPIPYVIYLLYMLSALLIVLIVMALADRLKDHAPVRMQLAMTAASAAGIFFLAYAMLGYMGEPMLIGVYRQDASLGTSAYLAMRVVSNALQQQCHLCGRLGNSTDRLGRDPCCDFPRDLASLLLLTGGLSLSAFLIPIFSVIAPLLYIIWSVWLGVFLLHEPVPIHADTKSLEELALEKSA